MAGNLRSEEYKKELHGLFYDVQHLRSSDNYLRYLNFLCRFKSYSPFNISLVYAQKPTTRYFATRSHWRTEFDREVKKDARHLVMLQPRGPVMFVFDITDTIGDEELIPEEIIEPFQVKGTIDHNITEQLRGTLLKQNIRIEETLDIQQRGGKVSRLHSEAFKEGARFLIDLNKRHSQQVQMLSLVHELSHICCGHIGSRDDEKWPDRSEAKPESMEFEAESVGYLVGKRLGLEANSDHYLSGYLQDGTIPEVSVHSIIRCVDWIEKLIKGRKITLYKKKK